MVTVDEGNVIMQAESVEPLHLKIEDQPNQIKVVKLNKEDLPNQIKVV